jgi:hypothetical protein
MSGAVIADDCIRIESAAAKVAENTIFRLKGQKVELLMDEALSYQCMRP